MGGLVQDLAGTVYGVLAVDAEVAVEGVQVPQEGDPAGDAAAGHKGEDAFFPHQAERAPGGVRHAAATLWAVVQQGAVYVEKQGFDHTLPFFRQGRKASASWGSAP